MKSPTDIAKKLSRQWHQSDYRLERLLSPDSWPIEIAIGKPKASDIEQQSNRVNQHIAAWRQKERQQIGRVTFQDIRYRAAAGAVEIPVSWQLDTPSQWVEACDDQQIQEEFAALEYLINRVDNLYWELLIRQRSLWQGKVLDEVVNAARLADTLTPGIAAGRPLRLLSGLGVDTKFFERHSQLLTKLLDQRYSGQVSEQGLNTFLDASDDKDHWVLVVPLSHGILPFKRLRLTTKELQEAPLPVENILIIENEQCVYQLPEIDDCIAVLGAGLDLHWLQSPTLTNKNIGYWGDMDSWGLLMLSRAKHYCPSIQSLLMNRRLFDQYADSNAVAEPVIAQEAAPEGLSAEETDFYRYLLSLDKGRLEQEFLAEVDVKEALVNWAC